MYKCIEFFKHFIWKKTQNISFPDFVFCYTLSILHKENAYIHTHTNPKSLKINLYYVKM